MELAKQYFTLKQQTEKNAADIRELQQQMKEVSSLLQALSATVNRNHDNEQHEREKLVLRLENTLLRFEARLLTSDQDSNRPAIDP